MKKLTLIVIILLIGAAFIFVAMRGKENTAPANSNIIANMKIESSVFENSRKIPVKYTCDDKNTSPPLTISGVPESAKSLALIVDDPDAPAGTWVHWTIWNMDPALKEIEENSVPEGIEGVTSFGKPGYGGPCPPSGTHRYFFRLYALDTILSIPETSDKSALEKAMESHILTQTELTGLYIRK